MTATASRTAPSTRPGMRIEGVDAARGIALIGMFVAHVAPAVASVDAAELIALADERPRLLFALTAGIGLGLLSGGVRPADDPRERGALRRQVAIRAVMLVALTMAWLISRRMARSVQALSDGARGLADGEGAAIHVETGDELAEVAAQMNQVVHRRRSAEAAREVGISASKTWSSLKTHFGDHMGQRRPKGRQINLQS